MARKRNKRAKDLRTTVSLPEHVGREVEQLQRQTGWTPPQAIAHVCEVGCAQITADQEALKLLTNVRNAATDHHVLIEGAADRARQKAQRELKGPKDVPGQTLIPGAPKRPSGA